MTKCRTLYRTFQKHKSRERATRMSRHDCSQWIFCWSVKSSSGQSQRCEPLLPSWPKYCRSWGLCGWSTSSEGNPVQVGFSIKRILRHPRCILCTCPRQSQWAYPSWKAKTYRTCRSSCRPLGYQLAVGIPTRTFGYRFHCGTTIRQSCTWFRQAWAHTFSKFTYAPPHRSCHQFLSRSASL